MVGLGSVLVLAPTAGREGRFFVLDVGDEVAIAALYVASDAATEPDGGDFRVLMVVSVTK